MYKIRRSTATIIKSWTTAFTSKASTGVSRKAKGEWNARNQKIIVSFNMMKKRRMAETKRGSVEHGRCPKTSLYFTSLTHPVRAKDTGNITATTTNIRQLSVPPQSTII
jgi:hypothetical protein